MFAACRRFLAVPLLAFLARVLVVEAAASATHPLAAAHKVSL
jgi:hypothetical protein